MAFPGDYNWKVDITAQSSQVDSNESNFPYYFDLSNITSTDFWNNVQSDGGDLRVSSDSAGSTQLPLEVVSIDTVAETGEIHFKDSTDSASNKTYYLWWDDSTGTASQPAVTGTYGRNAVWSAYEAVYHLQESSGSVIDSTGNGNDGTNNGATRGVTGQIEEGFEFDGTNDKVIIPSASFSETQTVSAWFNKDVDAFQEIVAYADDSLNADYVRFGLTSDGEVLYRYNNGVGREYNTDSTFANNTWFKATWFVNGSYTDVSISVNGSDEVLSTTVSSSPATLNNINSGSLGNLPRSSPADFFNGTMDEVRIAQTLFSSGWDSTEYNIQNSNSTFWSVGTPEEAGGVDTNSIFYGGGL